jgi:glycosyltransferase involved in cell wall biosynthesis
MRIVLIDASCPSPYSSRDLVERALGGSEACVVNICDALAQQGYDVIVAQHNRKDAEQTTGANYVPYEALDHIDRDPDYVICFRKPVIVELVRKHWSKSKVILWAHDFNQNDIVTNFDLLKSVDAKIYGVSRFHKTIMQDAILSQVKDIGGVRVGFIYNSIADDLVRDATPVNPKKLIFFSSPHKGLNNTLRVFDRIHANDPSYELHVANPGYIEAEFEQLPPGVKILGKLPYAEVLKEVRSSFAVLHLNDKFPETFGMVNVEANAVGTPVLTIRRGANCEVLNPYQDQIVDIMDERAVMERLERWQSQGRPKVSCKPEFRRSAAIASWKKVLV